MPRAARNDLQFDINIHLFTFILHAVRWLWYYILKSQLCLINYPADDVWYIYDHN